MDIRQKLRHIYYAYIKSYFIYKETCQWNILDNWQTLDYLLSGQTERFAVKGKYTNEVDNGNHVLECKDSIYLEEIICEVK